MSDFREIVVDRAVAVITGELARAAAESAGASAAIVTSRDVTSEGAQEPPTGLVDPTGALVSSRPGPEPHELSCPTCGSSKQHRTRQASFGPLWWLCTQCGHEFKPDA